MWEVKKVSSSSFLALSQSADAAEEVAGVDYMAAEGVLIWLQRWTMDTPAHN